MVSTADIFRGRGITKAAGSIAMGYALTLAPAPASSADGDYGGMSEETFFSDMPVVVTVTRLPQDHNNLPASVTVIDRRMIDASGAVDIPDLLRLVPGFQVGHVSGTRTTVTYHGLSDEYSRRMQVTVDGRSVYLPATGGVEWFDLPLSMDDIERIEVIRGPNGVTYGANAFLGVINIITRHPSKTHGTFLKVRGSDGHDGNLRQTTVRYGGRAGDLDYRLTMEYRSDDGYDDVRRPNGKLNSYKDDKTVKSLSYRGEYRAGVNDYLGFQFGMNAGRFGDGYPDDLTQPPHENQTWRHFEQLDWKRVISSHEELELRFYHDYSDLDASYYTATLSDIFQAPPALIDLYFGHPDQAIRVVQDITSERHNLEFQHRFSPAAGLRLVWGAEARLDQVTAPGFLNRDDAVQNRLYRLFAHGEWLLAPGWVANAGAMIEKNDMTGTEAAPRVALNRHLGPNNALRLSYTQAHRTPVILEEYADYSAKFPDGVVIDQLWKNTGGLEAERISAWELGLSGQSDDRTMKYDLRLFREQMRDLIATPIDRNYSENYSSLCAQYEGFCTATLFFNDGHADLEGAEAQVEFYPDAHTLMVVGFSRVHSSGQILNELNPTEYIDAGRSTPKDTLSVLVGHDWAGGFQASLALYHVSDMRFIGGDETGGFTTADLKLAQRFRAGRTRGQVSFTAQDILGSYFDYADGVERVRRAYVGVEFEW